jgi:hypothetical protein
MVSSDMAAPSDETMHGLGHHGTRPLGPASRATVARK